MEWRHLQQAEAKKAAAAGKNASSLAPTDDNTIFTLHNETMELLLADNRNASHLTDVMVDLSMNEVRPAAGRLGGCWAAAGLGWGDGWRPSCQRVRMVALLRSGLLATWANCLPLPSRAHPPAPPLPWPCR
jgi:hypothetical protein